MPAPSLRIPLSLTMDDFNKGISAAKGATATRFIVKRFIDMNASLLATGGAAGSAVLAFLALLGVIGLLSAATVGVKGMFDLMGTATEFAKQKIEEFNEIATSPVEVTHVFWMMIARPDGGPAPSVVICGTRHRPKSDLWRVVRLLLLVWLRPIQSLTAGRARHRSRFPVIRTIHFKP
jgi:hypothetical protein